jgi:long-subunit acyl-CoA synthetase (AMP-forming)
VLITDPNFNHDIDTACYLSPCVTVSFMPSALASDRIAVYSTLTNGGRVGFVYDSTQLFDDLSLLRPTIFYAPPLIWNTLYAEYTRTLQSALQIRTRELQAGKDKSGVLKPSEANKIKRQILKR